MRAKSVPAFVPTQGPGKWARRVIRALGRETGCPIVTFEQRSSFFPSTERAPHRTTSGTHIFDCGRVLFDHYSEVRNEKKRRATERTNNL